MYQNIFIDKKTDTVHLWDDEKGYMTFPVPRYAYKKCTGGQYKSIYGDELEKVYNFNNNDPSLFESDVPDETRVLIDTYMDSDEPAKGHRVGVIDIEVDTVGGFPNMETADKAITSIALYDDASKTCFVFILDTEGLVSNTEKDGGYWIPQKDWKPTDADKVKVVIRGFDNEDNLLVSFMDKWQECGFTIVTGWNIDGFDMPYLYTRLKVCLGAKAAKFLSPIGICYINGFTKKLNIAGISCLDYLSMYKKIVVKMEPSYTLGAIGQKIVGMTKVHYKGNLNDLYKSDIEKFIEYNITDVKIVVALDKKLQFIDLVKNICHTGHVPLEDYEKSSRYLDGTILVFLKRNGGLVAPNKPAKGREEYEAQKLEDEDGFSGAFVKEPVPGKYNWVFDLDLTSMYPNIIISLNMSPETKVGKLNSVLFDDTVKPARRSELIKENNDRDKKDQLIGDALESWMEIKMKEFDMDYHVRNKISQYNLAHTPYTRDEFLKLIKEKNYALSSNGVLYKQPQKKIVGKVIKK